MPIFSLRYISNDVKPEASTHVYRYSPDSEKDAQLKGVMHAQVTVIGKEGILSERISKFVWEAIVDSYYYSSFTSVIPMLKEAIEQGKKKALELIKNDENGDINLSFAIAVFKDKGVYLTILGEQSIFVFKNGGVVNVSQIISQSKGVVASMAWSSEDLVIMSSPELLQNSDIAQVGDNTKDVVSRFERSGSYLKDHESILILSNYDFENKAKVEVKKVQKVEEKIVVPEPEVEKEIESVEEVTEDRVENEIKVDKKNFKERFVDIVSSIKKFFSGVSLKVSPVAKKIFTFFKLVTDKIYSFLTKLWSRLNILLLDKYGRTHWYKKIMSKVSLFSFGKKKGTIGMKIDGYKETDLRKKRFSILFLAIFGIIGVFLLYRFGTIASNERKAFKEASSVLAVLEERVNRADKERLTDFELAQNTMFTITDEGLVTKLDGLKMSQADSIKYANVKRKYFEIDDSLNNRKRVSEGTEDLEIFLDGRAEFGDLANLTDVISYKDEFQNEFLLLVDSGNQAVYKVSMVDRTIVKLGDKSVFKSPRYIDYGVSGIYVYDAEKGMMKSQFAKSGANGKFSVVAGLDKDVLGEFVVDDIAIITSSDNVYLLTKEKKAIYRSSRTGVGYQYPTEYISSKTLAGANNMTNDISVFVSTTGDNGILRYSFNQSKGVLDLNKISIEGVGESLGSISAIYTTALENSFMYIFDAGMNRIIKFEKPVEGGERSLHPNQLLMTSQYLYNGTRDDIFKNVKELASDYNENFLFILDGNRILKLKVKE